MDNAKKLKWLKVRLTARALYASQQAEATRASFDNSTKAMRERFEPAIRKMRFRLRCRSGRKRKAESWADLADDLRVLSDKAYSELKVAARERLSLIVYLGQIENLQVTFGVT